jgi:hypothetical protein
VIEATEQRFGRLNVMVANAGIGILCKAIEMSLPNCRRQTLEAAPSPSANHGRQTLTIKGHFRPQAPLGATTIFGLQNRCTATLLTRQTRSNHQRSNPNTALHHCANRLPQYAHICPRIGFDRRQPVRHRLDREVFGEDALLDLLPVQRRRHRGAAPGPRRIGGDRCGAAAVAEVVDIDAALPCPSWPCWR